jgi:hypothetical protein
MSMPAAADNSLIGGFFAIEGQHEFFIAGSTSIIIES